MARISAAHRAAAHIDETELYAAYLRERPRDVHATLPSGTTRHVVQDRDTLTGIALRYGT